MWVVIHTSQRLTPPRASVKRNFTYEVKRLWRLVWRFAGPQSIAVSYVSRKSAVSYRLYEDAPLAKTPLSSATRVSDS